MASYFFAILLLAAVQSASVLVQQFEAIASKARGRVGVAAMLVETGRSAGFHADERFPMQSVYKLPIALAALHEVDRGRLSLDQKIQV